MFKSKLTKELKKSDLIYWNARCEFEKSYDKLNEDQERWCSECAKQLKHHANN